MVRKFVLEDLPTWGEKFASLFVNEKRGHAQLAAVCDKEIQTRIQEQFEREGRDEEPTKKEEKAKEDAIKLARFGIEVEECAPAEDDDEEEGNEDATGEAEEEEEDDDDDEEGDDYDEFENPSAKKKHKGKRTNVPSPDPRTLEDAGVYAFANGVWHLLAVDGPVARGVVQSIHFQTLLYRLACAPAGDALQLIKILKKTAGGGQATDVDDVLDRVADVLRRFRDSFPPQDPRELASQIIARMVNAIRGDKPTAALYAGAKKYTPGTFWYLPLSTQLEPVSGGFSFIEHEAKVKAIAISPAVPSIVSAASSKIGEELLCATGSEDGEIRVWGLKTGLCLHAFESRDRDSEDEVVSVTSLAFSPNQQRLAAGYQDGNVRIFELCVAARKESNIGIPCAKSNQSGEIISIAFSKDGNLIRAEYQSGKFAAWNRVGESAEADASLEWCLHNHIEASVRDSTVLGMEDGAVGFTCDLQINVPIQAYVPISPSPPPSVVVVHGEKVHILKVKR